MTSLKYQLLKEAAKGRETFSSSKFSLLLDECVKIYGVKQ